MTQIKKRNMAGKTNLVYLVCLACLACGCRGGVKKQEPAAGAREARTFPRVTVPALYAGAEEQAAYLAAHFWDRFDFTDTVYVHLPEVTDQALADYLHLLGMVPPAAAKRALKGMLQKADACPRMLEYFQDRYEHYLYHPDSPYRNDALYEAVLEALLVAASLDEIEKLRPLHQQEMIGKNRVGEPAADFAFTDSAGKEHTLYGVEAEYLLLFFSDPDCRVCKGYRDRLAVLPGFQQWCRQGRLRVLTLYIDDNTEAWRAGLAELPAGWLNGHDRKAGIRRGELYDLRVIPTLYLLDRHKRVVLKDVPPDGLERWIGENYN